MLALLGADSLSSCLGTDGLSSYWADMSSAAGRPMLALLGAGGLSSCLVTGSLSSYCAANNSAAGRLMLALPGAGGLSSHRAGISSTAGHAGEGGGRPAARNSVGGATEKLWA